VPSAPSAVKNFLMSHPEFETIDASGLASRLTQLRRFL
jgi:hypothetical protein